ncbi:MAG: ABC transporter permease [Clostridia bacterium]|nr:ABC transporter permease [Clostridia bacterium]
MTVHKVRAMLKKDVKNDLRNGTVILFLFMPVFFTLLYGVLFADAEDLGPMFLLIFGILMNCSMFPISGTGLLIAEEKEKSTLRTLMLSNVSATEFLFSKAVVSYVLCEAAAVAIYLITAPGTPLLWFLLITTLTTLCLMLLGAVVGILSPNQMTTGILGTPLTLIMLMPPIFGQINEAIGKIARFVPTNAMIELLLSEDDRWFHFAVLAGWIVIGILAFVVVYRRKRLD